MFLFSSRKGNRVEICWRVSWVIQQGSLAKIDPGKVVRQLDILDTITHKTKWFHSDFSIIFTPNV